MDTGKEEPIRATAMFIPERTRSGSQGDVEFRPLACYAARERRPMIMALGARLSTVSAAVQQPLSSCRSGVLR